MYRIWIISLIMFASLTDAFVPLKKGGAGGLLRFTSFTNAFPTRIPSERGGLWLLCNPFVVGAFADLPVQARQTGSDTLNLTLIYSGDEQGLLTAHGCDKQIGGLDRRHTLIKSLCEKRENALNLHTGNIVDQLNANSELIYQIALDALSTMSYDAVCLGPRDLFLSVETLKAVGANYTKTSFVCANIEVENVLAFAPYVVSKVPSDSMEFVKVAVVSLISKTHEFEVKAYNPSLTVIEPSTVLANLFIMDKLATGKI